MYNILLYHLHMRYCEHLQTLVNQGMSYCDKGGDVFDCRHCKMAEWNDIQIELSTTYTSSVTDISQPSVCR